MKLGKQVVRLPLHKVCEYIDWSMFFYTWEMPGQFPKILSSDKYGVQSRKLYFEAQTLLEDWIKYDRVKPCAAVGIWPANAVGDDIEFYGDESRKDIVAKFFCLRQQKEKTNSDDPFLCLSDFLYEREGGMDYCGAFAVTSGREISELAEAYKREKDDYSAILVQSLGDRLAEASTEYIHKRMRDEFGLANKEGFRADDEISSERLEFLIKKRYDGIRPAFGYPSLPDHSEKATVWKLMHVEESTGIQLTENFAMNPQGSTCGLVFFAPESHYFAVGKITEEQLSDYAARKGVPVSMMRKWLRHNLTDI